jgi:hypothetical protein
LVIVFALGFTVLLVCLLHLSAYIYPGIKLFSHAVVKEGLFILSKLHAGISTPTVCLCLLAVNINRSRGLLLGFHILLLHEVNLGSVWV